MTTHPPARANQRLPCATLELQGLGVNLLGHTGQLVELDAPSQAGEDLRTVGGHEHGVLGMGGE